MSHVTRKPDFSICENKDADQLHSNCEADQRLCFGYTDSTIPLLPKSEISSLLPSSVAVQPGLCQTLSETPKTGFLTTRLISKSISGDNMSHVTRKPDFCICENKDTDQLGNKCPADQRLCFCYIDNTIPLLFKPLAIFCGCTAQFASDPVRKPRDRFSHYAAL